MDSELKRIYQHLYDYHRGRSKAIVCADLQIECGISRRTLLQACRDLRVIHKKWVMAMRSSSPRGLFIAQTLEELKCYRAQIKADELSISENVDALDEMIASCVWQQEMVASAVGEDEFPYGALEA